MSDIVAFDDMDVLFLFVRDGDAAAQEFERIGAAEGCELVGVELFFDALAKYVQSQRVVARVAYKHEADDVD